MLKMTVLLLALAWSPGYVGSVSREARLMSDWGVATLQYLEPGDRFEVIEPPFIFGKQAPDGKSWLHVRMLESGTEGFLHTNALEDSPIPTKEQLDKREDLSKREKMMILKYGWKWGMLVAENEVDVGMTPEMVVDAWGKPDDPLAGYPGSDGASIRSGIDNTTSEDTPVWVYRDCYPRVKGSGRNEPWRSTYRCQDRDARYVFFADGKVAAVHE